VPDRIVAEEIALLDRVRTLLAEVPYVAPPREKDIVAELMRLREEIPRAKEEDKGALLTQYDQQHALLDQLRASRDKPEVDPDSPYFAHLRLEEDGVSRDLCLGKATRIQRGIRIVDWRNAPISRIFYAYQQGDEYEEEMGDRVVTGEVVARRTVTIERGELVRVDAPEGIWRKGASDWTRDDRPAPKMAGGEGAALRAHSVGEGDHRRLGTDLEGHRRRLDKRLPDIAGLIDPDQFRLITRPSTGFVVIRGAAGSGKTTVALHRIAWLAYDDPAIDSDRTMFVVFSEALRDYVAHVLPALGVHRVQVVAYREWASQLRIRHFPRLPRAVREDTPAVVSRMKLHPMAGALIEAHIRRTSGPATGEQALDDWMSAFVDVELMAQLASDHAPDAFSDEDLARVAAWCRDCNDDLVAHWDGDKEVEAMLDPEDEALLLRCWQLRAGPLRGKNRAPLKYRHVALDEVQDLAPIEVQVVLDCLDERRSITLAGDTQQHVMQDAGFTSWADFFAHLGVDGAAIDTLKIAYRSTRPIVSFALEVLGDLREDAEAPMTTRDGPGVEFFRFTDHGACVAFLAEALDRLLRDEPMASVAVLTPSPDLSALYHEGLTRGEVPRLRRVFQHEFTFAPGVEVTEVPRVKGLEFDYVVLVEVSAFEYPDSPGARRILHVGATRAVHQLWLTSVATPSPILSSALPG
jgi:DNA helicase-2/ATP-dependent DNA helicase PcrA